MFKATVDVEVAHGTNLMSAGFGLEGEKFTTSACIRELTESMLV